jgi:hypothetical protein
MIRYDNLKPAVIRVPLGRAVDCMPNPTAGLFVLQSAPRQVHHGRIDWPTPGGPEFAVSSGQLVAQLGDFAAEVLVAPVRGLQPANQGRGRGPLPGRLQTGRCRREASRWRRGSRAGCRARSG